MLEILTISDAYIVDTNELKAGVPSPGGYGLSFVQRQTISSSVLQVQITLQKTKINGVEQWSHPLFYYSPKVYV
jgi:hypothetical protein